MSSSQVKDQSGFSLLETLVASTIFAAVLLIASTAFKFFMAAGARPINSEVVIKETMEAIRLRNSIKGLSHYYLKSNAVSSETPKPFFLGSNEGFTGITLNALDYPKQPARLSVSLIQNKSGSTDLIYCEYDNKAAYPVLRIKAECKHPRVLATNIEKVNFSYFGWQSLNHLYGITSNAINGNNTINNDKSWFNRWDANQKGLLPYYIRIDLSYTELKKDYHPTQLWFEIADADPVQFSQHNGSNE